jgi:ABC-type transporter Mla subunit MlaD
MKANLNQVADDVKSLSRIFRAVNNLADTIGEIGDIDSYKAEAEKGLATARLDLQGAVAELDDVKKLVAEQNAKLKSVKDLVAEKIKEAEQEANNILLIADTKAKLATQGAEDENNRLQGVIKELNQKIKGLVDKHDEVLANIESDNAKLQKIKDQASKLFAE